jgi:hypothetical protein
MKLIETLKRRHVRLEHDLAAERARRVPDPTRVARLKKLKLAVKDRLMLLARQQRREQLPVSA